MRTRLWLTWERQRRNRTASAALGADLVEIEDLPTPAIRYPRSLLRTVSVLLRRRPRLLFAQNPSLVLATLAVRYGRLTGTPVVIDAHNSALEMAAQRNLAGRLARHVLRNASLTIVSNDALTSIVRGHGGRAAVLPDPLPELPGEPAVLRGAFNVLFICTWAEDEPYLEVLKAAEALGEDIRLYVTGRSKGRERALGRPLPKNVELTGFVSEAEFIALLRGADLIVDLTTREDCLVCGAYEAVAVTKPLLLSDTRALRSYFHSGTVFTDNSADDIARKILEARRRRDELQAGIIRLKQEIGDNWRVQQQALLHQLALLETEHQPLRSGA